MDIGVIFLKFSENNTQSHKIDRKTPQIVGIMSKKCEQFLDSIPKKMSLYSMNQCGKITMNPFI